MEMNDLEIDGLIVHQPSVDVVDCIYPPGRPNLRPRPIHREYSNNGNIQRSQLRVLHAHQDHILGDPLGGSLVTYRHRYGQFIHRFEELNQHRNSILRDSLSVRQNDQLLSINGRITNSISHGEMVTIFLHLPMQQKNTMLVGNPRVDPRKLKQISYTLYGYHKEEPEMMRVENVMLENRPTGQVNRTELFISPRDTQSQYLNGRLEFVRSNSYSANRQVHFVEEMRTLTDSNFNMFNVSSFRHYGGRYMSINPSGNVRMTTERGSGANFLVRYGENGKYQIKLQSRNCYLTVERGRLTVKSTAPRNPFRIGYIDCKSCI